MAGVYLGAVSGPWLADDTGLPTPVLADGQIFNGYYNEEHGPTVDGLTEDVPGSGGGGRGRQSLDGLVNGSGRGLVHS